MPGTMTLTYGVHCQPERWEGMIGELRGTCGDTQFSSFLLRLMQEGESPDFIGDLNRLLNQCVEDVRRDELEICLILETSGDADPDIAALMADWADVARKAAKDYVAVWHPKVNLIWILQDSARNREAAEILLRERKDAFNRRFIITTKRSNLTVSEDTGYCWQGIHALLRVLSEQPELPASDMTIGYARLQSSVADMQRYAKDRLAQQLRGDGVTHDSVVDRLKEQHPDWEGPMIARLMEMAQGEFCYFPADGTAPDSGALPPKEELAAEMGRIAAGWGEELLGYAERTMFPEDFLNLLGGERWRALLDTFQRDHIALVGSPLKKDLIHGRLIEAYNDHLTRYKERFGQLLQALVQALRSEADRLRIALAELIERRGQRAGAYLADTQFVSLCENAFINITARIKSQIINERMTAADTAYLTEGDYDRAAWDAFFTDNVAKLDLRLQDLRDDLLRRTEDEMRKLCEQNIDGEADLVHARMLHESFERSRNKWFFLMPSSVVKPRYDVNNPVTGWVAYQIDAPGYGNIEKLVLAGIPDPLDKLTSFRPAMAAAAKALPGAPGASEPVRAADGAERETDAAREAALPMTVQEWGLVSFPWPKINEDMLTLYLIDAASGAIADTQTVMRSEFQSGGSKTVFTAMEGRYGVFIVSLRSSQGELASAEVALRLNVMAHDRQKTIRAAGRTFIRHTLRIDNEDLNGDDIQADLLLRLDGGRLAPIPGKRGRRFTEWVIVNESEEQLWVTTEDRPGRCYQFVIE